MVIRTNALSYRCIQIGWFLWSYGVTVAVTVYAKALTRLLWTRLSVKSRTAVLDQQKISPHFSQSCQLSPGTAHEQ